MLAAKKVTDFHNAIYHLLASFFIYIQCVDGFMSWHLKKLNENLGRKGFMVKVTRKYHKIQTKVLNLSKRIKSIHLINKIYYSIIYCTIYFEAFLEYLKITHQ